MNTTNTYTPLESLLLFRGIDEFGCTDPSFASISQALQNNKLVREGSTYNAERLRPESLRELFLDLLWGELRAGSDATSRLDGGSSPASKKRKLQPPPRPTCQEAPRYIKEIEAAHRRLRQDYVQDAVAYIRILENQYELVQEDIEQLKKEAQSQKSVEETKPKSHPANKELTVQHGPAVPNGVAPSPAVSPRPTLQAPPPPLPTQNIVRPDVGRIGAIPPAQPSQPAQPTLPQLQQPPQPPQALQPIQPPQPPKPVQVVPDRPGPALPTPAPIHPQIVPSSRPAQSGQQGLPQAPIIRAQETTRPPNGVSPGLQLPQGVPSFHPTPFVPGTTSPLPQVMSENARRPEEIARPRQTPIPPPVNPQAAAQAQGQLKWEPPYQPHTPSSRQTASPNIPQIGPGIIQPPQAFAQQRPPPQHTQQHIQQHTPQTTPRPLQPQSAKPPPQQVLIAPQNTGGQYPPHLQPVTVRPPTAETGVQPQTRPGQQLLAPNVQQSRTAQPIYHGHPQPLQGRPPVPSPALPLAASSPRTHPGLVQQPPPPRPPQNLQTPSTYAPPTSLPASPLSVVQGDAQRGYHSPYQPQPRPAIPDRIQQQRLPGTPGPVPPTKITPVPFAPQTPAVVSAHKLVTGSGTKWGAESTPSTPSHLSWPRLSDEIPESPAYEALSPVLLPAAPPRAVAPPKTAPPPVIPQDDQKKPEPPLAAATEQTAGTPPKRKVGRPRASQKAQEVVSPPKPAPSSSVLPPVPPPLAVPPQAAVESTPKGEDIPESATEPLSAVIKDEVTTPKPLTETGDTTADESVTGRRHAPRLAKRKREEESPTPVQTPLETQQPFEFADAPQREDSGPTDVLWTRGFNKVSGSAMEQIVHHRSANMFAAPIREKDAPGYHKVILQPQDLKSIKAAINAGNRAAAQGAAALPGGDPNTSSVWLTRTEALLPPRGIINSGQLDRELAHMFANAIMYNPDAGHGPGPAFLIREDEGDGDGLEGGAAEGALGYQVDEFGVVNDARAMFMEVDKLLSELRSAEVRRTGGGRAGAMTGTSTRQASVAQREASHAGDDSNANHDEADEQTATEAEGNTAKRRRTTRG